MNTHNHIVRLYIHPDNGPVTPMDLNVSLVQEALYRVPGGTGSDEVGVREISDQIRKRFPQVNPESNRRQLVAIMGRLSHADMFNGIVIRLGGTINDASAGTSQAAQHEIKAMAEEVTQMKKAAEEERRGYEALKVRVYGLENENRRLKTRYEQAQTELASRQAQEQQARREETYAREALARTRAEADRLTREVAALTTRLEMVQQERPTQEHYERELAALRHQVRNLETTVQQLQATVGARELENADLREQLRRLTEGPLAEDWAAESEAFAEFDL